MEASLYGCIKNVVSMIDIYQYDKGLNRNEILHSTFEKKLIIQFASMQRALSRKNFLF